MALVDLFHALGASAPGKFLAASTGAFAATESLHILGLAALGGSVIVTDLAAVGAIFRKSDPLDTARSLAPVSLGALLVMAASGVLLVSAGPMKYYSNPLFPWKFALLAPTLLAHLALYPGLRWARSSDVRGLARILGGLSLAGLLGVTILGRWVGLI
jgi:hypothetical protein